MKVRKLILMVPVALLGLNASGQLVTTPSSDADALASLLVGSGISVVGGTPLLVTDISDGAGSFTGGSSIIGIDTGVILSTGSVSDAPGPNSSDGITTNGGGSPDSTSLSFDFTTDTGDLFFKYVFASDEYNEFANSDFNDSFELLVDGVNIALIPGTTTPVEINTVNAGTNSAFFNNNDLSDTSTPFDIEYDGFTTVFTAAALGLDAGTHTIEFVVADVGDNILDSAVFIEAGSFSSVDPTVPEPSVIAGISAFLLIGLAAVRRRRKSARS